MTTKGGATITRAAADPRYVLVRSKYGARRTEVNGILFDSAREAHRYQELALAEKAEAISALTLQPRWQIVVNGLRICTYTADFRYVEDGAVVVEDTKGVRTRDYVLRRKLMKAVFGIDVRET